MENLARYIYDYSYNNSLADESFVAKIYEMLKEHLNIEASLRFTTEELLLARYIPSDNVILMNNKLILNSYLMSLKNETNINLDSLALLLNLLLTKVLIHEIEHLFQEKKIKSNINNFENSILYYSFDQEDLLKKVNNYNRVSIYNPSERQAEIKGLKEIRRIVSYYNKKDIKEYISSSLEKRVLNGYLSDFQLFPAKIYFEGYENISSLIEDEKEKLSLRLDLGLKVNKIELKERIDNYDSSC